MFIILDRVVTLCIFFSKSSTFKHRKAVVESFIDHSHIVSIRPV